MLVKRHSGRTINGTFMNKRRTNILEYIKMKDVSIFESIGW